MPWELILSQDQQALLLRRGCRPPRRFVAQPAAFGIAFACGRCALVAIDPNMQCSGSCYNACRIDDCNVVWKEVGTDRRYVNREEAP